MTTAEKYYLEWMFLNTMLGHFVEDNDWEPSILASFTFNNDQYELKMMYDRYVWLTKELLKIYKCKK